MRPHGGRFLDGSYKRLCDAYVATMADLGVAEKLPPDQFLEAMNGHKVGILSWESRWTR